MVRTVVGILLFNDVEVLDFAGPYEVFVSARDERGVALCEVCTLGETRKPVRARGGLRVTPDLTLGEIGDLDLLLVPGGPGARGEQRKNRSLIDWIREAGKRVPIVASVCTGAFLLAEAGLLDERRATTHRLFIENLRSDFPAITVVEGPRFVDDGSIASSAGVSAGIDLSLALLARLHGHAVAAATAAAMEYAIYPLAAEPRLGQ